MTHDQVGAPQRLIIDDCRRQNCHATNIKRLGIKCPRRRQVFALEPAQYCLGWSGDRPWLAGTDRLTRYRNEANQEHHLEDRQAIDQGKPPHRNKAVTPRKSAILVVLTVCSCLKA